MIKANVEGQSKTVEDTENMANIFKRKENRVFQLNKD